MPWYVVIGISYPISNNKENKMEKLIVLYKKWATYLHSCNARNIVSEELTRDADKYVWASGWNPSSSQWFCKDATILDKTRWDTPAPLFNVGYEIVCSRHTFTVFAQHWKGERGSMLSSELKFTNIMTKCPNSFVQDCSFDWKWGLYRKQVSLWKYSRMFDRHAIVTWYHGGQYIPTKNRKSNQISCFSLIKLVRREKCC